MKMTAFCTLGYVAINTKVLASIPSFFFLHCLTKYYQNLLKSGGKYEYLQSFTVPYFQENLLKSYSTCSNIWSPVFESVMYIHSVGLFLVGLHRYPYCKENLHFRRTTFVRCHLNDIVRTFSASVRGCQVLLFKSGFLQLKRLLKNDANFLQQVPDVENTTADHCQLAKYEYGKRFKENVGHRSRTLLLCSEDIFAVRLLQKCKSLCNNVSLYC